MQESNDYQSTFIIMFKQNNCFRMDFRNGRKCEKYKENFANVELRETGKYYTTSTLQSSYLKLQKLTRKGSGFVTFLHKIKTKISSKPKTGLG